MIELCKPIEGTSEVTASTCSA